MSIIIVEKNKWIVWRGDHIFGTFETEKEAREENESDDKIEQCNLVSIKCDSCGEFIEFGDNGYTQCKEEDIDFFEEDIRCAGGVDNNGINICPECHENNKELDMIYDLKEKINNILKIAENNLDIIKKEIKGDELK